MLVDQLYFTVYVMFHKKLLQGNGSEFVCTKGSSLLVFQLYDVIFNRRGVLCQSLSGKHGTFCFDIISTLEQSRIETLVGCAFCDTQYSHN